MRYWIVPDLRVYLAGQAVIIWINGAFERERSAAETLTAV
jgi:hypothetical protein